MKVVFLSIFLTYTYLSLYYYNKNGNSYIINYIAYNDINSTVYNNKISSVNTSEKKTINYITVETDVFSILIDKKGGDVFSLRLLKYPNTIEDLEDAFTLLGVSDSRFYVMQSGLLSDSGPDSRDYGRSLYKSVSDFYTFDDNKSMFFVDLIWESNINSIVVKKRFYFTKGSYLFNIVFSVYNNSNIDYSGYFFGQLKQKNIKKELPWYKAIGQMQSYTGLALSTNDKLFTKVSFGDLDKKNINKNSIGGWIAAMEHYFISSWIPTKDVCYEFTAEKLKNNIYSINFITKNPIVIKPLMSSHIDVSFYAGPEINSMLKGIAPGLELTLDYGLFWFISQPIFYLMKFINVYICNNWGFSIIIVTFVIRLLFLPLSASSYKSMAKMRKIQPKVVYLKEYYKDDKQGFGTALLGLYKKESVNPLGGCLPVLVQIPVFIALYYVLLQSVELRMAPFIFWLKDLSTNDPYFVLPILMGVSMFVQQKLSPTPVDPIQEKFLLFIPIILTLLSLQFASGLVLYWFVNNTLSILQQWYIFKKYSNL
jgi:YidC/Oxa1 family membrane protein insertase